MMTTNNIKVNGYELLSVLELSVHKEIWEHPTAYVEGHISEELSQSILDKISKNEKLTIKATDATGIEKIIFSGVMSDIGTKTVNNMTLLYVSGIGNSVLADMEPKIRTFQDNSMTYKQVTQHMSKDKENSQYLLPNTGDKSIGSMLVQYDETNWEFSKRLASRLGTVVVANSSLDSPFISIGLPSSKNSGEINTVKFEVVRNLHSYWEFKEKKYKNATEYDSTSIKVTDRTVYDLCDKINFNGESLLVYEMDINFVGSEMIVSYILKSRTAFVSTEYCNEKIIGASISGIVKEVQEDMVRVELFKDIDQTKHKWFVYLTPYSSPDGTGWYFMPEIGDEIRLHFPTQKEKSGYVISSTHITHGARSNPEIKFIRTIRNQSITFYPDAIHIDDGQGSEILMDKKKGIEIKTDKAIKMSAQDNIEISSQSKVKIKGNKNVQIKQNDSLIHVDDTIDISASHVRVQ